MEGHWWVNHYHSNLTFQKPKRRVDINFDAKTTGISGNRSGQDGHKFTLIVCDPFTEILLLFSFSLKFAPVKLLHPHPIEIGQF